MLPRNIKNDQAPGGGLLGHHQELGGQHLEQLSIPGVDFRKAGFQLLLGWLIGPTALQRSRRHQGRGVRWGRRSDWVIGWAVPAVVLSADMVAPAPSGKAAEEGDQRDLSTHDRNHPW